MCGNWIYQEKTQMSRAIAQLNYGVGGYLTQNNNMERESGGGLFPQKKKA